MDHSFAITSVRDGSKLELLDPSNGSMLARLSGPNFNAAAIVYEPELFHFGEFFAGLALAWKGCDWRRWQSLEHHLSIDAAINSTGHVTLKVDLHSGLYPLDWKFSVTLVAEAGQLERIARDAKLFVEYSAWR
jgi:hypothetical protein